MNQKELLEELKNCLTNSATSMELPTGTNWQRNYHSYREQAWDYQRKQGISGLVKRTLQIRGCSYETLKQDDQLILLPSDIKQLRDAKQSLVDIFLRHSFDIYEYAQDLVKSSDYPYFQVPVSRLHQRCKKSDWADMWYDSDLDQLHLSLGCGADPVLSNYLGNKYTRDHYDFVAPAWNSYPTY